MIEPMNIEIPIYRQYELIRLFRSLPLTEERESKTRRISPGIPDFITQIASPLPGI